MQAIPLSLNRTWLTKAAPPPHPTPKTNNIKKKKRCPRPYSRKGLLASMARLLITLDETHISLTNINSLNSNPVSLACV